MQARIAKTRYDIRTGGITVLGIEALYKLDQGQGDVFYIHLGLNARRTLSQRKRLNGGPAGNAQNVERFVKSVSDSLC
jgi:hypothetical protein